MQSIYQLVAIHKHADAAFKAKAAQDERDEALFPFHARLTDSVNAILDHRPATIEEARAKGRYLQDLWNAGEDDFGKNEMRRLLSSLAAA